MFDSVHTLCKLLAHLFCHFVGLPRDEILGDYQIESEVRQFLKIARISRSQRIKLMILG